MNTDKLQAGSKLDTLMAELMGWTRTIEDDPANVAFLDDDQNYYIISDWPIQVQRGTLFGPSVSEDSAGIVTDWLVAQGYAITVYTGQYQDQGVKARCCILHLADLPAGPVDAIADKRPLAICRAALKARERWGG